MRVEKLPESVAGEKRRRARKPKVKSGCVTCKIRRVKCDETKPVCCRCIKFGVTCDGYEEKSRRYPTDPRLRDLDRRPILPKFTTDSPVPPIPRAISKSLFRSESEGSLFTYYCLKTAYELSGTPETSIWSRIILQASEAQPFLRDGIVVIGALTRSLKIGIARNTHDDGKLLSDRSPEFDTEWIKDDCLLFYYDKFLRGSRIALAQRTPDKRMALIVCLVVVCIERLQWRLFEAVKHIRSGLVLLDDWMKSRTKGQQPLSNPTTEPDIIENEIIEQFRKLDVDASMFLGTGTKSYPSRLESERSDDIRSMPQSFTTVSEATSFLERIIHRTSTFIRDLRLDNSSSRTLYYGQKTAPNCTMSTCADSLLPPNENTGNFEGIPCEINHTVLLGDLSVGTLKGPKKPDPSKIAGPSFQFEQEVHASEIRLWSAAFKPLFFSLQSNDEDYLAARILKLRSLANTINLTGSLSSTELVYDSFFSEFNQIVSLAKTYLSHPRSSKILMEGSFSLTSSLIYPLRLVSEKCRDRKVRREAIGLLKSKPWREGPWSSLAAAFIADWLMETEEEGVDTDWIPEEARMRLVETEFTEDEGPANQCTRATVRCLRGRGANAELKVASWDWSSNSPDGVPWKFYGIRTS